MRISDAYQTSVIKVAYPAWVHNDLGSPTGKGVRVGVIDSGWDRTLPHPHIEAGIGLIATDDFNLVFSDDDHDRNGHGTACADLILRIAPASTIYPIRVFNDELETDTAIIRAAILWAVEHHLHIVNLSLGTLRPDALHPLYAACELARQKGVILVAANVNAHTWSYPAIFENVISVGAGDFDSIFSYQYRNGDGIECIAKGQRQLVRWLGGRQIQKSGTSFAAPAISGIIALFIERYPGATLTDIRALLDRYATPVRVERG